MKPLYVLAILAALISPALALDFNAPINGMDGKPLTDPDTKANVTLGSVSRNALLATYPDEPNLAGEEKVKRWVLANKIAEHPDAALTVGELDLIKKLVGKAYNPLVTGQAWSLLDPASVPK